MKGLLLSLLGLMVVMLFTISPKLDVGLDNASNQTQIEATIDNVAQDQIIIAKSGKGENLNHGVLERKIIESIENSVKSTNNTRLISYTDIAPVTKSLYKDKDNVAIRCSNII